MKMTELEDFYMNNVKYTNCPAAQGAAIMNRQNKNSYLLGKFGLKNKGVFMQPRDWIFADRDEDNAAATPITQDKGNSRVSSYANGGRASPGRDAELSTKFRSVSWGFGVFHKLRICIVDIQDKRKPEFKKIIESNGGKVVLDLSRNKVDILLLAHPSGINFKNAKLWGVACIHSEWIEKSIEAASLLPLEKYRVVEDSENLAPPQKMTSSNRSSKKVATTKNDILVGCLIFGQQRGMSNLQTAFATRSKSECNSTEWKHGTPRVTNDTFNVSTRL